MENDAATLYCPNEYCQAANPLTHKFCQRCSTPLPKRYLWVAGKDVNLGSPGTIVGDRYLVIDKSILLDIKPGTLPQMPELHNLQAIRPYLKLIPYRLHIPQVYGVLSLAQEKSLQWLLLLEKPPLLFDGIDTQLQLAAPLVSAWANASSMRQIHWLWQLAHLWEPLLTQGVASSLLDPYLLRVEGALVRLLELHFDHEKTPSLVQLGVFWQQFVKDAKPAIANVVKQVSDALMQGEITLVEQLIKVLDQALVELEQFQHTHVKIITQTHTGPSRQRNEDACYPTSGLIVSKPPQPSALAIVCDGIGGHEGGNVASNLAIETIQQHVKQLTSVPYENIDASLLLSDLEHAVAIVNDKISHRNDTEHRHGRQRMGTTIVMGLSIAHEMYITHVGDSRAYWITRQGCYQVTLDDDVASREVRLGYATYREAVQQSGSGSLVQALGMNKSSSLHPTAQRFIVDEDAVFLLTSDGLSDFDRVEENWETEILPILFGEIDIEKASQKLIEVANTKNGHDNVTIALIHYHVQYSEPEITLNAQIPTLSSPKTVNLTPKTTQETKVEQPNQKTKVIPERQSANAPQLPLQLIVILVLLLAAGSVGYWFKLQRQAQSTDDSPSDGLSTLAPQNVAPSPLPLIVENVAAGSIIQINEALVWKNQSFPAKSFFQVTQTKAITNAGEDAELYMRICGKTPPGVKREAIVLKFSKLQDFDVAVWSTNPLSPCQGQQPSANGTRNNLSTGSKTR
jgi:protein phosphatase